jgi:putative ABC transport system ATP-binding protein
MTVNRFEEPARYDSLDAPIIRMRGITKVFQSAAGATSVLKNIDVDILQGQFVSVVGRSGSGKSTLVNMITGIDRPSTGTVEIGNLHTLKLHESDMAVWRGKNLGIVFQFFQLLPMLTILENIMLPMDFCNIYSPASREERALSLLQRLKLEELANTLPGAIAGGQQQCAAVARALANDPPILIADEPTGNLDSNTAEQVMDIFTELSAQGKTILMVTHDRSLAQRTNRRLLISDGELIDEALAAAFPDADPTVLLQINKQAVPVDLAPGSPLAVTTAATPPIYLVTQGEMVSVENEKQNLTKYGGLIDPTSIRHASYAGNKGSRLLGLPRSMVIPLLSSDNRAAVQPSPRKEKRRTFFRRLPRAGRVK